MCTSTPGRLETASVYVYVGSRATGATSAFDSLQGEAWRLEINKRKKRHEKYSQLKLDIDCRYLC